MQSSFREDQKCTILCRIEKLDAKQVDILKSRIADDYRVNMYVEGADLLVMRGCQCLPVGT